MSDLPVTASIIEYQLIRPGGSVVWSHAVASWADPATLRIDGDVLSIDGIAEVWPPWLLQRREYGPEWVTIAERGTGQA